MKNEYKSIFISDVHLGHPRSQIDKLINFIGSTKSEYFYIVGDFIDFYHLFDHHGWSKNCNTVTKKLLSRVKKGTHIKICIGNHDALLGIISGYKFGEIEIAHEFIHTNKFIDYLVLHGDKFDKSMKHWLLTKLLCTFYTHFYWLPLVNIIKKKLDRHIERNIDTKEMIEYARLKNTDGIIFGHTHMPRADGPIKNCGDWLDNCSALVERLDGEFDIIRF